MRLTAIGQNLTYVGSLIWSIIGLFLCFAGAWIMTQPHVYTEQTTGTIVSCGPNSPKYTCNDPTGFTYSVGGIQNHVTDHGIIESNKYDVSKPGATFPVFYDPSNPSRIHLFDANNPTTEGMHYFGLGIACVVISGLSIGCVKKYEACATISGLVWAILAVVGGVMIVSQVNMIKWIRNIV